MNWPLWIAIGTAVCGIIAHMWGRPKSLTEMSEAVSQIPGMNATLKELKQDFKDSQQRQWDEINLHTDRIAAIEGEVKSIKDVCAERHRTVPRRRVG